MEGENMTKDHNSVLEELIINLTERVEKLEKRQEVRTRYPEKTTMGRPGSYAAMAGYVPIERYGVDGGHSPYPYDKEIQRPSFDVTHIQQLYDERTEVGQSSPDR